MKWKWRPVFWTGKSMGCSATQCSICVYLCTNLMSVKSQEWVWQHASCREKHAKAPCVCDLKFFAISHWWHEMSCSSLVLVKGSCLHVVHWNQWRTMWGVITKRFDWDGITRSNHEVSYLEPKLHMNSKTYLPFKWLMFTFHIQLPGVYVC